MARRSTTAVNIINLNICLLASLKTVMNAHKEKKTITNKKGLVD